MQQGPDMSTRLKMGMSGGSGYGGWGAISMQNVSTVTMMRDKLAAFTKMSTAEVAAIADGGRLDVEHPTGRFTVDIDIAQERGDFHVTRSALLRTARKLMDGYVYVSEEGATTC